MHSTQLREQTADAPGKPATKPATQSATTFAPSSDRPEGVFPRHLTKGSDWAATLAQEQMHVLATHVLARHTEQGLRTLAVTSAIAGEGKTTVSLALSEKLASTGKRVLIIDLDTHRATLSAESNLAGLPGVIETISRAPGKVPTFPTYPTNVRGVFLMPAGNRGIENSVPLLDPECINNLIQRALDEYDIVLLDCPPLLPVADSHLIAKLADSAILVVRAGSTPKEVLTQAVTEVGPDKFFAAILNRAQPHRIPYFGEVYGYYRRDTN